MLHMHSQVRGIEGEDACGQFVNAVFVRAQGQKPLVMRLRLGYTPAGGAVVVEQTEIKNFPAGL